MKHLKRLLHGALVVGIMVSFVFLVLGVCAVIDDFIKWHYRNSVIEVLMVLTILYLIGLIVELF